LLDLLVGIAHVLDALIWIGHSLRRVFCRAFLPRSHHNKPLELADWLMLGFVALIVMLVISLWVSGA
jgi:hypothetical protein